jgi:hypothetical protein
VANWMTELEELVKGMNRDEDEPEYDGGDEGDEEEDEEETPEPKPRARKGVTSPKNNAETTNSGGEPSVHDPKSLDKRSGGGAAPVRKSLEDVVSEEAADAMEVSGVLAEIAKGINTLAGQNTEDVTRLRREVARLAKSVDAIGTAVVKGLTLQVNTAKSLKADVEAIGAQPAGRKSIAKSVEKTFAGNEEQETAPALPSANEIMVKSMAGIRAGRINAQQASQLETARQKPGMWGVVAPIWERVKDLS